MKEQVLYHFDDHTAHLGKKIFFTDKHEATKAGYSRGEWGGDAYVSESVVCILDTAEKYRELVNQDKLEKVLEQLTDSDIALLKTAWGVK